MNLIKTDQDFGIIIRKSAIPKKGLTIVEVKSQMLENNFLGENDKLISYGPHFGIESAEEITQRLTELGLSFWEDFFIFYGDIPYWVDFWVTERSVCGE